MTKAILALDAGGTSIKAAVMADGEPRRIAQIDFMGESREALLRAFREALRLGEGQDIAGIGVGCPGPFDFQTGTSRMEHKWKGIRNVPLPPLFQEAHPGVPVRFLHDSTAYMLGEGWRGAGCDAESPAGVMLGTGFGFSCMKRRRVVLDPTSTPLLKLWCAPFREGTVEDYVSRRAIRRRYALRAGGEAPDVKEIATLARAGNLDAAAAFAETGAYLGEVLCRYLPSYCDRVVIGGQVARSIDLFLPTVKAPVPVVPAAHLEDAALRGIAVFCMCETEELTVEE